jgi:hypothetical protein
MSPSAQPELPKTNAWRPKFAPVLWSGVLRTPLHKTGADFRLEVLVVCQLLVER